MRVAIDARSLSERHTSNRTYWAELVEALGRREDVELLLISDAPIPEYPDAIFEPSPSGRWFSFVTLPRVAKRLGADLAHVQYTVSPLFRVPVVTMVHDVSFLINPSWFGLKDRTLLRATVPASCRRAARVVAPSETCKREIVQTIGIQAEKIVVTLEGTPSRLLRVKAVTAGIESPYVLLVGGASPRKNLMGAVEAVRLARETVPHLRLLVTGRLEASLPDWVVAPGPLDEPELAGAYRGAHALLHPSYHEGFGLTILEAMSLGCPVVTSDRGAIPEIAGDAATICGPEDTTGMAQALIRLFDGPFRTAMIEKGKARAASFTWDTTAAQTIESYRQAIQA